MTTDDSFYGTRYPGLESMIETKHNSLKQEAAKRGKELGMDNLPNVNDISLDPYGGFIPVGYKGLHAEVEQFIKPDMHRTELKTATAIFTEKKDALVQKIAAVDHKIKIAERESGVWRPENKKPDNTFSRKILAILFFLCEFLFTSKIFEYQGEDMLTSFGIGALLTICSYFLAKFAVTFLDRAKTEGRKMYALSVLCAGGGIALSIVLSLWRAKVMNAATDGGSMSPLEFAILNVVIFIVAILISSYYLPKQAENEAERQKDLTHNQTEQWKKERAALAEELKKLEDEQQAKILHHQEVISLFEHTTRRINTLYLETMETFKGALLAHRSDRLVPKCLYHPVPDLFNAFDNKR